jgi:hypothetical protein
MFSDPVFVVGRCTGDHTPSEQYRNSVLPQLKNGHTSVAHEEGAECTSTATNKNNESARYMVLLNAQVTIDEVANHLQINHSSAY